MSLTMGKSKKGNEAKPKKKMPTAYILMTKYKDGDPEIAGVFSSFDKAVAYFMRTELENTDLCEKEFNSAYIYVKMALKMAHRTDDDDYADFGNTRAWIDEYEVDDRCEDWEKEDRNDSK